MAPSRTLLGHLHIFFSILSPGPAGAVACFCKNVGRLSLVIIVQTAVDNHAFCHAI